MPGKNNLLFSWNYDFLLPSSNTLRTRSAHKRTRPHQCSARVTVEVRAEHYGMRFVGEEGRQQEISVQPVGARNLLPLASFKEGTGAYHDPAAHALARAGIFRAGASNFP
jgi:hypothetical protein